MTRLTVTSFQWSTDEQEYPLEVAADGSTLYAVQSPVMVLPSNGYTYAAHGISNLDSSKVHSLTDIIWYTPGGVQAKTMSDYAGTNANNHYKFINDTYFAFRVYIDNGTIYSGLIRVLYSK